MRPVLSPKKMKPMKKEMIFAALFALVAVSAFSQTDSTKVKKEKENRIAVNGTVADSFTKAAIPDVKVTLLREDSTVVGTMRVWKMSSYSGVGQSVSTTNYHFLVSREPAKYILKFEHPNYETTFADFEMKKVGRRLQDVEGPKVYMKKAAKASHFEGGEIGEVEVKATKIKMVWKGDTLVYNADAFNVPEGSMLDGLIKQLPGVELKDNGEIFVNGKKIENLTLNGADFFKGKNKIMLENLPYFTVKNVKVYKKQTELNKYLGIDDENKKEYTMDVVLKREYSIGGSANVEAGGGPSDGGDWRYKLKGFGLRFSDRTRAVAFGGLNNINESMHYSEWKGEYDDRTNLTGDNHFKQVGGQFVYQAPEDKLMNSTEVSATWSNDFTERRSQSETFMNEISTFGKSEGIGRSKPSSFALKNEFRSTGKFRFSTEMSLSYERDFNESEGWSLSTSDALFQDSINSIWSRSRSKLETFRGNADGNLAYRLPSGDYFSFNFDGSFYRYRTPEESSLNHYVYHQLVTRDIRDRRTNSPSYSHNYQGQLSYHYQLTKKIGISPSIAFKNSSDKSDRHEYLRDSIDYIFDALNSYEQHTKTSNWQPEISLRCHNNNKKWYYSLYAGFQVNFLREKMDYTSEPLTTSLTRHYTQFVPSVSFHFGSSDNKHNISSYYNVWSSTPSVIQLIDRPITSDPLNIFLGNPDLKQSHQHYMRTDYTLRHDSIGQTIRFSLSGHLTKNAQSSGYTYDPTTGVKTHRAENISGGNWNIYSSLNWTRALDKKKIWFIGNELSFRYTKSTGLTLTTGSTDSELSRVGTSHIGYKPSLTLSKNKLTLNVNGNFSYRHIHRNITFGEQPTDVWDIAYGLNGTYKLPWNFTFDTNLTMHSRRGYTDEEMNDNRLYWDASLTKSFKQGKWVVKLRGYDLLGQVSSLNYYISSQGRTERWTNSMRRYALLTVSYRFSQKPKKEKE